MSAKRQSSKEGFWPFGDWFPDPESDQGKISPAIGDGSGPSSTKNYPTVVAKSVGKVEESKRRSPLRKRVRRKNAS